MVAWNPGTPGPSARLTSHLLQNRHQAKNNGGEIVCCLAKCVLGTDDDTHNEERSDFIGEKWIADSGASFHMTHLADLLSDVRLGNDKVRGGDGHLIEVVGYGTLTVVFRISDCQIIGCSLRVGPRVQLVFADSCAQTRSRSYDRGERLVHFSFQWEVEI